MKSFCPGFNSMSCQNCGERHFDAVYFLFFGRGEISVICQDVRLLKEKFDERVPLSKSVSSSQTTCILASSGSSLKSVASLVAEQDLTSETLEKMSPAPAVDVESLKSRGDEKIGDFWRQLSDDGWDLFENETELNGKAL